MATYGRYRGGGTATAYPVMCAICGVVWPRSQMRPDGSGQLVCPDEGSGLDTATLDRLNARKRPVRQPTTSDGLYRLPEAVAAPEFVPIDGQGDNSGFLPVEGGGGGEEEEEPLVEPSPLLDFVTSVEVIMHLQPENIESNDMVSWTDSGTYGNHFVSGGDQMPTLVAGAIDGNQGLRFDGTDDQLWRGLALGLSTGSKPVIIVVGSADSDAADVAGTLLMFRGDSEDDSTELNACELRWTRAAVQYCLTMLGAGPTAGEALYNSATANSTPHWLMMVSCNATGKTEAWFDGVLRITSADGDTDGQHQNLIEGFIGGAIGWASDANLRSFKGLMTEFIVLSDLPTTVEFNAIKAYLAARYPSLTFP